MDEKKKDGMLQCEGVVKGEGEIRGREGSGIEERSILGKQKEMEIYIMELQEEIVCQKKEINILNSENQLLKKELSNRTEENYSLECKSIIDDAKISIVEEQKKELDQGHALLKEELSKVKENIGEWRGELENFKMNVVQGNEVILKTLEEAGRVISDAEEKALLQREEERERMALSILEERRCLEEVEGMLRRTIEEKATIANDNMALVFDLEEMEGKIKELKMEVGRQEEEKNGFKSEIEWLENEGISFSQDIRRLLDDKKLKKKNLKKEIKKVLEIQGTEKEERIDSNEVAQTYDTEETSSTPKIDSDEPQTSTSHCDNKGKPSKPKIFKRIRNGARTFARSLKSARRTTRNDKD